MGILMMRLLVLFIILAALYWAVDSRSVPPNFCLAPLNMSDCGLRPTPMYSYFGKGPHGLICKVALWRGCPSDNMFHNEKQCAKFCSIVVEDDAIKMDSCCTAPEIPF